MVMETSRNLTLPFLLAVGLAAFSAAAGTAQPLTEPRVDAETTTTSEITLDAGGDGGDFAEPVSEVPTVEVDVRAWAEEMGVRYELTPTEVVFTAETDDIFVVRPALDGESRVFERLAPGEPRAFERERQVSLLKHFLSLAEDCKCPTPKEIPPLGGWTWTPRELLDDCPCHEPWTRFPDARCYEDCKDWR